jgi:hypothetical protein
VGDLQGDLLGVPVRRRRVWQAEFHALEPNGIGRASDLPCDLGIRQLAEQSDLLGRPGLFADGGAQMPLQVVIEGALAVRVPLGLGEFSRLHRRAAFLPRGPQQPIRPVVVHLVHLERSSPSPHHEVADTPPVPNGCGTLVPDSSEQFVIDEQAGSAALVLDGPAARPGNRGIGPRGDDHFAVSVETRRAVAFAQGRRAVRSVEQSNAVARVHGVERNG